MDIEHILSDFIEVCRLSNIPNLRRDDIKIELGHPSQGLQDHSMAIYIFMHGDLCYKVGKVHSKSMARYLSHHYNPSSSNSNLAKSLVKNKIATEYNISDWIKTNTQRVNLILNSDKGIFVLNLLEAFLHCRLNPKYEGFESQKNQ